MCRFALFFIASFLLITPTYAQDGYPLPLNLPTITPENAAQLSELASIGGVSDNEHPVVGTLTAFNGEAAKVFFTGDAVRGYNLKSGRMLAQQPPIAPYSEIVFGQNANYFLSFVTGYDAAFITTWSSRNPAQPL